MTPDEWRDRVGRHLEARREALGYSSRYQMADGIEVSESWVRQMESGEVRRNDGSIGTPNPRGNKLRSYLDRLDWPADAIHSLLNGMDPDDMDRPSPPAGPAPWDEMLERQRQVSDALEEMRGLLAEIAAALRAQRSP